MGLERTEAAKYVGAAALLKGLALKPGSVYKEVDIAVNATDKIQGISKQDGVQNDNIGYAVPGGQSVKVVLGGTVTIGAYLVPTTAGKFIATTTTQTNFWGTALEAGVINELREMNFQPGQIP